MVFSFSSSSQTGGNPEPDQLHSLPVHFIQSAVDFSAALFYKPVLWFSPLFIGAAVGPVCVYLAAMLTRWIEFNLALLCFSLLVYGLLCGSWGLAIWLLLYALGYGYTTVLGFLETIRLKKMLE